MLTKPMQDDFGTIFEAAPGETIADLDYDRVIAELKKRGMVMFSGFGASRDDFDVVTDRVGGEYMNYKGGGYIRKTQGEEEGKTLLSTSTTIEKGKIKPMTIGLPLHAEMFYTDKRPLLLWFFCVTPPEKDGQTTVADGVAIYQRLPQKWKDLLHEKRLMYLRTYPDGVWQNIYQTEDIATARAFCAESGMTTEFDAADKTLRTTYLASAVPQTHWGGHTAYINSAMTVVMQENTARGDLSVVRLEDGSKLPREMIEDVQRIQAELIIELTWASGDFVLIDNSRTMHGRRAFEDTRREVYLRMVESVAF